MSTPTSSKQFDAMVAFMENHSDLAKGYINTASGREKSKKFWDELTLELNSLGPFARNTERWKKVWADFKQNLKKKVRRNKLKMFQTGGGPNKKSIFSDNEKRVEDLLNLNKAVCDSKKTKYLGIHLTTESVEAEEFSEDQIEDNTSSEERYCMPAYCIVVNCMSTNKEFSFFSFPKNEYLKQQWIKAVPTKKEITENARVCEKHFLPTDIIWSQKITNTDGTEMIYEFDRPQIKQGAIPRILPTIVDINPSNENQEEMSQEIEVRTLTSNSRSINFETVSMPLPSLKRKCNSPGIGAKRKHSMQNDPISFFSDEIYSSTGTLNTSSNNKIHTNMNKTLDKEAEFRENLQDFGNFIISTLNGIYDEAIMLNAQQEISMVCFEAKSKWIAKKKSIYG